MSLRTCLPRPRRPPRRGRPASSSLAARGYPHAVQMLAKARRGLADFPCSPCTPYLYLAREPLLRGRTTPRHNGELYDRAAPPGEYASISTSHPLMRSHFACVRMFWTCMHSHHTTHLATRIPHSDAPPPALPPSTITTARGAPDHGLQEQHPFDVRDRPRRPRSVQLHPPPGRFNPAALRSTAAAAALSRRHKCPPPPPPNTFQARRR